MDRALERALVHVVGSFRMAHAEPRGAVWRNASDHVLQRGVGRSDRVLAWGMRFRAQLHRLRLEVRDEAISNQVADDDLDGLHSSSARSRRA